MANAYFRFGGAQYPLPQNLTSSSSLLAIADPIVAKCLDYFSTVLTTNIGNALAAVSDGQIASVVAMTLPANPARYARYVQEKTPLLAVWRKGGRHNLRTIQYEHSTTALSGAYILPPMLAGLGERVEPVLTAVSQILQECIRAKADPSYESGANVWSECGVETIGLVSTDYGAYTFDERGDNWFPSLMFEIELTERAGPSTADATPGLAGVGITITDGNGNVNNPFTMVQAQSTYSI